MMELPEGRTLRIYVATVVGLGACMGVAAAAIGRGSNDSLLLLSLVLAGAVSERFKVSLFGDSHVSSSAILTMVAAVVGGPRDAVIVAALLGAAVNLGGIVPAYKTAFNVSVYVLTSLAFLGAFDALSHGTFASGYYELVPATVAVVADFALNALLVAVAIGMASNQSPLRVVRSQHLWLIPHYLPLGALVFVALAGYEAIGVPIIAVLALPVAGLQLTALLYSSLKRSYVARTDDLEQRLNTVNAELARLQELDNGRASQPAA
jgi:hypothetical protein